MVQANEAHRTTHFRIDRISQFRLGSDTSTEWYCQLLSSLKIPEHLDNAQGRPRVTLHRL